MHMKEFRVTRPQATGVIALLALVPDDGDNDLIPLDIPPEGTAVMMDDGRQVIILPMPEKQPKNS